jgi:hypothetical protein
LFFDDEWACAPCLELQFRSQVVPSLSKKWEKADELEKIVGAGKPLGMHNKTYNVLLGKLQELREALYGKERIRASDKYSQIVKSIWRFPTLGDESFFPGDRTFARFNKTIAAKRYRSTSTPIVSPTLQDDSRREFRGGYESEDPDDL